MGYAGICSPNVQNYSDAYFHAISIQEISGFISILGGSTCPEETATGNSPPTADAGPNYTIPRTTPFILKGIATDPDSGDVLSHNWEQMNQQVATMPPSNTSISGPNFRSNNALPSPNRYMPKLSTVLAAKPKTVAASPGPYPIMGLDFIRGMPNSICINLTELLPASISVLPITNL